MDMEIWKNMKLFTYIILNVAILFNPAMFWFSFILLAFNFTILESVEDKYYKNRK